MQGETSSLSGAATQVRLIAAALLTILAGATVYSVHEHNLVRKLSAQNSEIASSLTATRDQVNALTTRLNDVSALSMEKPAPHPPVYRKPLNAAGQRQRIDNSHWKKIQAQLDEQGKQIASTREDLMSARSEFGDSIARTHDELVALEKKGERNYYEFDIEKDGQFQRKGPVGIRLRKTNTKHEYADLELMVDDFKLSKKHITIYEPAVFYLPNTKLPVELVINNISKNRIQGYVTEPRYRPEELQAMGDSTNVVTPTGATAQSPSSWKPSPARQKLESPKTQ
jgi:hypothetical protein